MSNYRDTDIVDENGGKIFNSAIDANYIQIQQAGASDKTPDIDGFIRLRDGKGSYLNKKLDYQLKSVSKLENNKYPFPKHVIQYQLSCNVPTITFVVDVSSKKTFWYYFPHHIKELNLDKEYGGRTVDLTNFEVKENSKQLKELWEKIASLEKEVLQPEGELPITETIKEESRYPVQSVISSDVISEYQSELDHARDLIKEKKPFAALDLLDDLKRRVWYKSDNLVKYRILTNQGAAKQALGKDDEASRLFIEAYQFNIDDEKALSNLALGYLLIGNKKEASIKASEAFKKNPMNQQSIAVYLQSTTQKERESFLNKLTHQEINTPEVYLSLGFLAYKEKNHLKAEKYLRKAIDLNLDNSLEIPTFLAGVLIEKNIPILKKQELEGIKIKSSQDVTEAIDLLTTSWKKVENSELAKAKVNWLVNISFANRILGNFNEALDYARKAHELVPDNIEAIKNYAMLLWDKEDFEPAYKLFSQFKNSKDFLEAPYLMALIKREQKDFKSSIDLIKEQLDKKDIPDNNREDGLALLIETYIMAGDEKGANKVLSKELKKNRKNIQALVFKSKLLKQINRLDEAISYIKEAYSYLHQDSSYADKFMVASQAYVLKLFPEARDLLEDIIDKSVYSELSYRLLYSYFETNNFAKALALSDSLIEKHGDIKDLLKIQAAIYEEQEHLEKVSDIYIRLLNIDPNDTAVKIQLGYIMLRQNKHDELDRFLDDTHFDLNNTSLMSRYRLAYLFSIKNKSNKFLTTIYETRRKYYNEERAHIEYIKLFFLRPHITEALTDATKVKIGVAVSLRTPEGKEEQYVIDDRSDASKALKEITPHEDLAKKLIGKKIGDKVSIGQNAVVEVVGIKNKYVHALHESLGLFHTLFNNVPDLQGFQIGIPTKDGEKPEGFDLIEDQIRKQHQHTQQVADLYKDKKLTIGAFANLIGKNIIEVWGGLISDEKLGINFCRGDFQEREEAVSHLKKGVRIVVDPIALLTLNSLEVKGLLTKEFGKFGIAQSTKDLILELITQLHPTRKQGYLVLGQEGENITRYERTPESIQKNIKYLEGLLEWIDKNCDILPVSQLDDISKETREEWEKLFGTPSVNTILIAREKNTILLCDDERLRTIGKNEYNIEGIWTQALFMDALNKKIISQDQYDEFVIKLVSLSYYYVSVSGDNLFYALKKSNWKNEEPFISFLRITQPPFSEVNSAIMVSIDFLYKVYTKRIISTDMTLIIFSLLDSLTKGRRVGAVTRKLKRDISARFKLVPMYAQEINNIIDIWARNKIL